MKVTGYKLREAIRRVELQRDTVAGLFKDSLYVFEGEAKADPIELMKKFRDAEYAVAALQEAQQRYNLRVSFVVCGKVLSLAVAVKMLGGAGRTAKMWRDAIAKREDRYGRDLERSRDTEAAKRVVAYDVALREANKADAYAGELRAAVAAGNATEMEIEELEPVLFE